MKFEDAISNLGFEAVDVQMSIDNVSDIDENICIPAGWFVYTVA